MNKASWPLWGFVILIMLFSAGMVFSSKKVPSPLLGKVHPALGKLTLTGEAFAAEKLHNQIWLLNVWASWCSGCQQEHPVLLRLNQLEPDLVVVGLNYKDQPEDAKNWLREQQNPYDFVVQDLTGEIGINWGVIAVPETFLIDKNGLVIAKWTGALTEQILLQEILPAVNKANK